jgi:cysteine desulfurase
LFFSYFELDENCKILWRKEYVYADALIHIAAHNETGFICNWDKIFKKISNNTIFITDGSQYILREEYIPKRIDMMTISSHKIGGICGCGALILKNRISFLPTPWFGGYQEFGQRPGTEPVGIISSFGIIAKNFKKFIYKHKKLSIFRDYIDKMILNVFTDSRILFKKCKRLPNTTSIIFSFLNNRLLKILIDLSELCISFGSACNSLLFKKSNLLDYFISKEMVFFSIIRISLSNDMPGKVIEKGVIKLIHILKKSKQKNK